jgi:tetratricopeptide (TPR) repeat protein
MVLGFGVADSGAQTPNARVTTVGAAELAMSRGDRATATALARSVIRTYESASQPWTSADLTAVARAYVVLGDAASVRAALRAFDAAVAADPRNVDAVIRTGDLFLEKYNAPEARDSYALVLTRDSTNARALLGMARVFDFEGKAESMALTRRAVAADANLAAAHVMLARLFLEAESFDSATTAARRAIALDSLRVTPWALLGASAWLTGDSTTYRQARAAATRVHPRPHEFDEELAEAAVRNRRYAAAVEFANRALAADSLSARAWGILGTNQLRAGAMAEGRRSLERAFAIDPFHVWHKNTLDLLDQMAGFTTVKSTRIEMIAPEEEAELLSLYLLPLLEQAYDSLAARYDYRPPTPIRMEIFRRHADFSVRTVGLAGLGALGVSFGTVLAMDSPTARPVGEFNWGSTAWHELAHTFTLGASGHRVPRWMSEGLSVLEERRARPEWGAKASVAFIEAYKAGRLRKLSELNEGFVRPRYPAETIHSYYLASLVCEMIEEKFGAQAFPALLKAYRDGLDTPGAFQRVLKATPVQLDAQFDSWMQSRFTQPLRAIAAGDGSKPPEGRFVDLMRQATAAMEARDLSAAQRFFVAADSLFPQYGGSDGPNAYLARVYATRGDTVAALRALRRVTSTSETAWDANATEASWSDARKDPRGAATALERMIWISPIDASVHMRLAQFAASTGDHATAVRERRAVVAMRPTDMLEARYQLARALAASGDKTAARREILAVLEAAPGFEKAQTLLLELRGGTP